MGDGTKQPLTWFEPFLHLHYVQIIGASSHSHKDLNGCPEALGAATALLPRLHGHVEAVAIAMFEKTIHLRAHAPVQVFTALSTVCEFCPAEIAFEFTQRWFPRLMEYIALKEAPIEHKPRALETLGDLIQLEGVAIAPHAGVVCRMLRAATRVSLSHTGGKGDVLDHLRHGIVEVYYYRFLWPQIGPFMVAELQVQKGPDSDSTGPSKFPVYINPHRKWQFL